MKFFRRNKKVNLKQKETELMEEINNFKLSNDELLKPYKLPATFEKLRRLQDANLIDTQLIGFELWIDRPITPSPKDLIPFASTGGDSCHFSFITDFGYQESLENCPIAFISPTDRTSPSDSNFLIARNIREFLSLMISLKYAEHIRSKDIYKPSINNILIESIAKFDENKDYDELDLEIETIEKIIDEFEIAKITDYHKYFESVKQSRNQKNHLTTLDGLNIEFGTEYSLEEINEESINEYFKKLSYANRESKLVAIRNAPYKFTYYDQDYKEYETLLVDVFKELNLEREQRIQEYENRVDSIYSEWKKIRKQIINDKR